MPFDAKKYYESHKDKCIAKAKEWKRMNPDKVKISSAKSEKKRFMDPLKKIKKDAYMKTYRSLAKTKNTLFGQHLNRTFGISVEDYNNRLVAQNGVCKVCGKVNEDGRRLHVDHNHKTGIVRGLLCGKCNLAIGLLGDDVDLLKQAMTYLSNSVGQDYVI